MREGDLQFHAVLTNAAGASPIRYDEVGQNHHSHTRCVLQELWQRGHEIKVCRDGIIFFWMLRRFYTFINAGINHSSTSKRKQNPSRAYNVT